MRIRILGTSAAEGIPALFCNCDTCARSRAAGGRNVRSRSSILIDDILQVDLPPDIFYHSVTHGTDTSRLRYLLISHSHHDHFAVDELEYLRPGFAGRANLPRLQLYAGADAMAMTDHNSEQTPEIDFITIEPFRSYDVGEYRVTAIRAKHGAGPNPLNYIVEKDGKAILYNCDTGYYDEESWSFLADRGRGADMVISECTGGINPVEYKFHMGLPNVLSYRKKCEEIGLTTQSTPWILTHFSHNNGATYNEFCPVAEKEGFQVAYDGMLCSIRDDTEVVPQVASGNSRVLE